MQLYALNTRAIVRLSKKIILSSTLDTAIKKHYQKNKTQKLAKQARFEVLQK